MPAPSAPPAAADDASAFVQRVRHELKRRVLTVLRVQAPSPAVRSITLGGSDLDDFVSLSFDDHVKLFVPPAAGMPAGAPPVMRDYTPRHFDAAARELTIDFVLHGHGPAATWAAQAAPGQTVAVGGPRGSMVLRAALPWQWLVGDASARPAITRRLAELPAGAAATVVLIEPDAAERQPLPTAAVLQLHWVADAAAALALLRSLPVPAGAGYAWCAGEASAMAAVRQVLVAERGLDTRAVRAAAYWKHGAAAHHETLQA
ncbi:siderophore-interacting protein [Rubrivivax rivuli]|uniref:Siderophore-interacting protein n=1 Tax=Rubrivivax rivuli TaxID=1862385 RepID=A0A437RB41_9BURK|nr:siderophore-interacting protein [Rubrivivax rivuli]